MGELIAEIFLKWILGGIWVGLNMLYDWIKGLLFGVPKHVVGKKRLKKKWLYKKVSPVVTLDNGVLRGTVGTVMEIIDNDYAFVEFYDHKGDFIEIDGELAFKVELILLKLKT